ncbi:hypothetical protein ACOSP7_023915 [Xanthoceras sorbifolium]
MNMKSNQTTPERSFPFSEPVTYFQSPSSSSSSHASGQTNTNNKRRKNTNFVYRIREHVRMGPKFTETVKGKLSLGAKIIQQGGRENVFKKMFVVSEEEKLLKASQCYLSTTQGPIPGLLFISTQNVAFCSERSITLPSSTGQLIRTPYKVLIPIEKIKSAKESENVTKAEEKYIEIVTVDDFEFWFMGFLRFEKAFHNLQKAISISVSKPL